jgi:hypothetical protein
LERIPRLALLLELTVVLTVLASQVSASAMSVKDSVLKYTRPDLASLVYYPVRPLDVISAEVKAMRKFGSLGACCAGHVTVSTHLSAFCCSRELFCSPLS